MEDKMIYNKDKVIQHEGYIILIKENGEAYAVSEKESIEGFKSVDEYIKSVLNCGKYYRVDCDMDAIRNDRCFDKPFEELPDSFIIVPADGKRNYNWFASYLVNKKDHEKNQAGISGIFGDVLMCRELNPDILKFLSQNGKNDFLFTSFDKAVSDIIVERAISYNGVMNHLLEKAKNMKNN